MTWATPTKDYEGVIGNRRMQIWSWETTTAGTGGDIVSGYGTIDACVSGGNVASTQASLSATAGTVTITHTSGAAAGKCIVICH